MVRSGSNVLPSGINQSEAEEVIESIAHSKAARCKKIAYLGRADIRQEVRIKLWKSLELYDPARKVKLRTFLTVCADNRIRDIRRSLLYKHNKPCFRCPLWDKAAAKAGVHDCTAFTNKMDCEKYAKHEQYVQTKLSANNPIRLDDARVEDTRFSNTMLSIEMLDYIYVHLPSGFHPLFDKLKQSNYDFKALKPAEGETLRRALAEALEEYDDIGDVR